MPAPMPFCLASAAAFGAMGIFGKLAYDEGATVGTLLATRFVLAPSCCGCWWVRAGSRDAMPASACCSAPSATPRPLPATSRRSSGSTPRCWRCSSMSFPVIVAVAAVALRREPASRRTAGALALSVGGLLLVLAGAAGGLDPLGTLLGLATAVVYSAYVLGSEGIAGRVAPLALSTLVCTGAAATLTVAGLAGGDLDPASVSASGFVWLGGLAVVSTVGAIGLFFAGLRRVGPTAASILSTFEPVVTVALAFVAFGESLGLAQLAGGALVLLAVLAVRTVPRKELA